MSPEQVVAVEEQQEARPLETTDLIISPHPSPTCILQSFIMIMIVCVCVCVMYVGSHDTASLWRSEDNFLEVGSLLLSYVGPGD